MRRRDFITGIAVAAIARPLAAHAQGWPTQSVRIVCPLAAGGGIDATARIVAAHLSEIWRQQVVVENKSGASGNIAAEFVARSDPDGYTIYIATFPHASNSYLYPSLGYDPVADFVPVTLIGLYPLMMVVPNSSPAHSVREFIAYAKANKLSYASSGHGTSLHLAGELFKRRAGIEMTHVPYRGAGPAFNDLIPGRVDAMINFTASSLPLVRQGQLRALALANANGWRSHRICRPWRKPALPEWRCHHGRRSLFQPRRHRTSSGKFTTIRSPCWQSRRSEQSSNRSVSW